MENTSDNLLADIETTHLVQASTGKRFLNYLIDIIVFYIIAFLLAFFIAYMAPSTLEWIDSFYKGFGLLGRLISLILYGIVMGFTEALTRGRSVGKLITGTKAVNMDGSTITTQTAFLRGFCRAIPFNAFSAFGSPSYPWHDRWSDTYVIDLKESIISGVK